MPAFDDQKPKRPNPYAPRSNAHLEGLRAGLMGEDLSMPTEQEIEEAAGDPIALDNLISRAKAAQAQIDATRGREYGTQAGRVYVANPGQAVADMFVRGQAKKERDSANKSAEELSQRQRTADAKLQRRLTARDEADRINERLAEVEELNRKDAQTEATERTRLSEREQDRSDRSLRDQLDDSYRRAEQSQRGRFHADEIALGRDRIGADRAGERAKADAANKAKGDAYSTWQTAAGQYLDAHKNSSWGPGAGGNYGLRNSARANLAPVLKGIFRTSGEGTFSDRDQELLIQMAPSSIDTDEQAAKKLANIDAIIRSKMGIAGAAGSSAPASDEELIGRYSGR